MIGRVYAHARWWFIRRFGREECGCLRHPISRRRLAVYMTCAEHGYAQLVAQTRERQFGNWRFDEQHYPTRELAAGESWRFDEVHGWQIVSTRSSDDTSTETKPLYVPDDDDPAELRRVQSRPITQAEEDEDAQW